MISTLCVFCASSNKVDSEYINSAKELANICSQNNIHVLYGGGAVGLMGALADRIIEARNRLADRDNGDSTS